MKKYIIRLSLFMGIIFFVSCKDNSVDNNPGAVEDFPNEQGISWFYRVIDSLNNTIDTVQVTVSGTSTLSSGEPVTVWLNAFSDSTDSNYVLIKGDSVKIYEDREYLIDNIKLVFPLAVGATWKGDFVSDSSRVLDKIQLTVPAGSFNDVYVIERLYGGFNEYFTMTIWFVPDIGIIKINRRETGFGFQNETRELISYSIP